MTELVVGETEAKSFVRDQNDFLEEFDTLGIHDSRRLRQMASLKQADRRLIVCFNAITVEAQNALLKTLEEPAPGNYFILLTPTLGALLPTFLSRCQVTRAGEAKTDALIAKQFVVAEPTERLEMIGKLLEDEENAKGAALAFLNNLERYLAQERGPVFALEQIRVGRDYLQDKAGLPRLILEHIALVL